MTALRRYVLGLGIVAAIGAATVALTRPMLQKEVAAGELIGLALQAPLGWWTLRSIGSASFQVVWVGGMVIRLAVVALMALLLGSQQRWDTGVMLLALVGTLLLLLLLE